MPKQTKTKKVRMTNAIRAELLGFASREAGDPKLRKAEERAYAAMHKAVCADTKRRFTASEYNVLKKFNVLTKTRHLSGYGAGRQCRDVNLLDRRQSEYPHPETPRCYTGKFPELKWSADTMRKIDAHKEVKIQLQNSREAMMVHYRAVINSAKSLQEVVEVWPASAKILDPYIEAAQAQLPAVSNETLNIVRTTNVGARVAA